MDPQNPVLEVKQESLPVAAELVTVDSDVPVHERDNYERDTPEPDGGAQAWIQVMGSFCLFVGSWGIVTSFGLYQTYYEESLLQTSSASAISWIGSVQGFLLMLGGPVSGVIFDAGHLRFLLVAGCTMIVTGLMLTSIAKEYWQVLLAQAILVGLGGSLLNVPSIAVSATYFRRKRSLAQGIGASGSSIGGVLYPIIFHNLQPKIGFAWTVRVIAFILLALFTIPITFLKLRVKPTGKTRKMLDFRGLQEIPFDIYIGGIFLGFMGVYVAPFYVESFALDRHITDTNLAFYLIPILNGASTFGRILPNYFADKVGTLNVIACFAVISGILILCWISISNAAALVAFCALYGFFSGPFVSLVPVGLISSSKSNAVVGAQLGAGFAIIGIGMLIGTPIGGAVLANSGFLGLQLYGGLLTVACGLIVAVSKIARYGKNPFTRA